MRARRDFASARTSHTASPTFGELLHGLVNDTIILVQQEFRLFKAEMVEKLIHIRQSSGQLVAGALVLYAGLVVLILAAIFGFAEFLPFWLAALLIGLLFVIFGALTARSGQMLFKQVRWAPTRTLTSVQATINAVSGLTTSGRRPIAPARRPRPSQTRRSNEKVMQEKISFWQLLKLTFRDWMDDQASQLAAALAYYTAVSIAPLLVLIVVLVGLFLGAQATRSQLLSQLSSTVGPQGAQFLQAILENAQQPTAASLAGIVGIVTLLWGSTNLFSQLQSSLNAIWNVELRPGRGIWDTIKARFFSFTLVLGAAFLLLVSLILSAILTTMSTWGNNLLPGVDWVWEAVNFGVSFLVTAGLFAAIYKILPDAEIRWRDVGIGALVTALLFTLGKFALGLYLSNAGSAYGVAGSVVAFLLWVYYSAQILFFGAEFTQIYARYYGQGLQPAPNAVLKTQKQSSGA